MTPYEPHEYINHLRKQAGWSVRRLGREAGLSAGYVSQLENDKRPLTARAVARIADALTIPPYRLLAATGFLPADRIQEAEEMARKALDGVPSIAEHAVERGAESRFDWLVVDYLCMLGEDPYGHGIDQEPGCNQADWRPLVPDAPEPLLHRAEQELAAIKQATGKSKPLVGWSTLSPEDQEFVQGIVDRLHRQ